MMSVTMVIMPMIGMVMIIVGMTRMIVVTVIVMTMIVVSMAGMIVVTMVVMLMARMVMLRRTRLFVGCSSFSHDRFA